MRLKYSIFKDLCHKVTRSCCGCLMSKTWHVQPITVKDQVMDLSMDPLVSSWVPMLGFREKFIFDHNTEEFILSRRRYSEGWEYINYFTHILQKEIQKRKWFFASYIRSLMFAFLVAWVVTVFCWFDAYSAPPHQRLPRHQRELGPGREGRHGDDAQQNCSRRSSIQTFLRRTRRHGMTKLASFCKTLNTRVIIYLRHQWGTTNSDFFWIYFQFHTNLLMC